MKTLKTRLALLCLLLNFSAVGLPQICGANFFMKEIKLSLSKYGQFFAKVDDEDYEFLNQWKWYPEKKSNGYYARRKDKSRKSIYMHRMIIVTNSDIDHRNHDTLDNQRANLRPSTKSQNQRNKSPKKNGTSKYLGVHWDKSRKKWRATISDGKYSRYLGHFIDEDQAAIAYNDRAKKYHGEFANLNVLCA